MLEYPYGAVDPIPFALTDTDGDGVTGRTLLAADVQLSAWNDETSSYDTAVNIGSECAEGDNGFYYWTPSLASQTQHSFLCIFINDSTGSTFLQNRLILYTGGDEDNSRFRG